MLALSQDLSQNRPVEAREHVKRFHELFFTLSPDKNAIESNIRRALFLVDKSAFGYYKDLTEKGYYNRIISGNINQVIQVDSVVCNFDGYPYKVATYAKQMIIRESNVTERSFVMHYNCLLLNNFAYLAKVIIMKQSFRGIKAETLLKNGCPLVSPGPNPNWW